MDAPLPELVVELDVVVPDASTPSTPRTSGHGAFAAHCVRGVSAPVGRIQGANQACPTDKAGERIPVASCKDVPSTLRTPKVSFVKLQMMHSLLNSSLGSYQLVDDLKTGLALLRDRGRHVTGQLGDQLGGSWHEDGACKSHISLLFESSAKSAPPCQAEFQAA